MINQAAPDEVVEGPMTAVYQQSRSEENAKVALDELSSLAARLREAGRLSADDVELLYWHYRARFKSRRPFRMDFTKASAVSRPTLADAVALVLNPSVATKANVFDALVRLRDGFGTDQDFICIDCKQ